MTIQEALRKGIEILKSSGIETPVNEAGVMLCHVIKRDKSFLYSHSECLLSENEVQQFMRFMEHRALGEPLQYLTGHQEFMSLDFIVTPAVLIPRHDTEILVETVINHIKSPIHLSNTSYLSPELKVNILDIGTGSGCIAVSLAYYMEESRVTAVDRSQEALEVARLNAEKSGVAGRVDFLCCDVFDLLADSGKQTYDVIVSNPPYIPSGDIEELDTGVKGFEPEAALNGGADGMDFYRWITERAVNFLKPGGLLAFEVGYNQAGQASELMKGKYVNISIVKDLAGIERVVTGYAPF